jgi:hypothetical protein
MSRDDTRYVCVETKTALERLDADGATCGDRRHFHRRTERGFAGARPVRSPTYRVIEADPLTPLPPKDA